MIHSHILVVGGTGMLADAAVWLEQHAETVTVIGRKQHRHYKLQTRMKKVNSLIVDYADNGELRKQIKKAIERFGPITLVVSWIHSYAADALVIISEEVSKSAEKWRLFHIQGSSSHLEKKTVNVMPNCLYRSILLGFILEADGSRWLTNKEICEGVIKCVEEDNKDMVIGILEPWEKRP
ncbi:short-chain dehydrogenase [Metabacillus idriensis]|nr:hypothetical protein [Metabacillus idriensis]MCM3595355.1 short-chain dehydrogenase [Metabacillus idriensis]